MDLSTFTTYGELGLRHILDLAGYDHILFVLSLCCRFTFKNWKKVTWLITAFTIGHSLTLAISVLFGPILPAEVVEKAIPITIIISCISNIIQPKTTGKFWPAYAIAALFGFIHGMGFSTYLSALLTESQDLLEPLFSFNLGLELGQLIIVSLCLTLNGSIYLLTSLKLKDWSRGLSLFIMGLAVSLLW
jgi:hydrogenase/urease accessory protein HupE